ncbi:MAG: T9SS type A sorting domain-containing protein [Bacteroidota bacterium]
MLDDDTGSVFLVERKTGQADFRIIGGVNARNMKGINRKFSFQDQLPSKGNVAYRIRRESKQNIIFYSPVQELIRIQTAEIQLFNSLPGEDLHFQFELTQSAPYQIRLMDLQGRQLFYEESRANFGPSVHGRIPSSHLEKGLFLLQITTAQRRMTERILLR